MAVKVGNVVVNFLTNTAAFESDLKKVTRSLRSTGREFTAAGKAMTTHLTLPMVAFGAAVGKMANDAQKGLATIRTGTGATGQALEALGNSARAVARQVPNDFGQVSTAIADLNTRLGLSGTALEDMSTQMLNLARVTKSEVSGIVAASTRLFGDWTIATDKQGKSMDYLFKISQSTGIGMQQLMELTVQYGAPLRALGFDMEQAAAAMGKWEKEGVNMETVLSGLRMALGKFAAAGKDPAQALQDIQDRIKGARTEAEATKIAFDVFGQRAAVDLSRAIIEGRFAFDDLIRSARESGETINKAAEDSMALGEKLAVMRSKVMLAAEPLGNALLKAFDQLMPYLDKGLDLLTKLAEGFAALPSSVQFSIVAFAGVVAAIGPVLWMFGSLVTSISAALPVLTKLTAAIMAPAGLIFALKTAAAIGAFWVGWKLGELLGEIEIVNKAGNKLAEWITKIPGIAPNVKGATSDLEETTGRLATRLKELGVDVSRLANESLEDWNRRVVEASEKMSGFSGRAKLASEDVKSLTGEIVASGTSISTMSDEVSNLIHPMDELSARFAKFSADGMSAEQAIKLYSKEIVNAADMQRLLTGRLTETQQALAAKARAYADLISQRDTSKLSLLSYMGIQENYANILQRTTDLLNQEAQAAQAADEKLKFKMPEGIMPKDVWERPKKDIQTIDDLIKDSIENIGVLGREPQRISPAFSSFGREVSTIFTNMSQSIAGNIIEWKGWASTILGTIKSLARAALSALIQGLFAPMMNWLNKLGGGIGIGGGGGIGGLASSFGGKAFGGLLGIGGASTAAAGGTASATLGAGLAGASPIAVGGGTAGAAGGAGAGGLSFGGIMSGIGGAIQGGASAAMGAIGLGFLPAAAAIPVVGGIAAGAILGGMKLASMAKGPNAWQAASKEVKRDYGVTMSDKQIAAFFQSMGISEPDAWGVRWPLLKSPQFQAYMMALGKSPSMSKQGADYQAAHELAKLGDWSAYNELFLNEFGNIHSGTLDKITGWYDKLTVASAAMANIPKYQSGIDFVPRDGLAYLHRGERVTPANENKSVNVRLGDMHLTFNVGAGNTADMVQTFRNQIIPILKREMEGGPSGLRESIRRANATTAGAY